MSTNAARRTSVPLTRRRAPATILHLPVAGPQSLAAAGIDAQPGLQQHVRAARPRGDVLISVLLAVLLVVACLAWEALSVGL